MKEIMAPHNSLLFSYLKLCVCMSFFPAKGATTQHFIDKQTGPFDDIFCTMSILLHDHVKIISIPHISGETKSIVSMIKDYRHEK